MPKIKLINLCPHDIVLLRAGCPAVCETLDPEFVLASLPSAGELRLDQVVVRSGEQLVTGEAETLQGGIVFPLQVVDLVPPSKLPEQQQGVLFVVSVLVAATLRRSDLAIPGSQVRNSRGQVLGCRSLNKLEVESGR